MIILGFGFFPEYIYQLKTTCLLFLHLLSFLCWGIERMCYSDPNPDSILTCFGNISVVFCIGIYAESPCMEWEGIISPTFQT